MERNERHSSFLIAIDRPTAGSRSHDRGSKSARGSGESELMSTAPIAEAQA